VARRIVILGGGFGGFTVARALERRARPGELDVTLVDRHNYSLFTPMLPEVASGSIEPRHITPPFRGSLHHTTFELGTIRDVDDTKKIVTIDRPRDGGTVDVPFDELVIAVGTQNSTHGVPGADVHGLPLKTLEDAVVLRDAVVTALELAATTHDLDERRSRATFVVVGGGFTGVEAVGELNAYIRDVLPKYESLDAADLRVVIVAGGKALLHQLPGAIGERAAAMLAGRGVEVIFDDEVAAVDGGGLTLASGKRITSGTVVWSAGIRAMPLVEHLGVPLVAHHAIAVEPDLSVTGMPGYWALGDCAHVPKSGGGAYPQTAQHAVHEATRLARNLIRRTRGRGTKPYSYEGAGMMASIGAHQGVASLGPGIILAGLPAWFLWRTYYLSQLPSFGRKVRVAVDWTLDARLPKDIASIR